MKRRRRILVVDDEPTVREVLRRYLEREGWQVSEAADGRSALQLLREDPPDLLILDLMLPGVDGLSITRRLRGDVSVLSTERMVPIIMLTARRDEQDRVHGLELGADDYLTSPSARANWSPACAPCCAAATRQPGRRAPVADRAADAGCARARSAARWRAGRAHRARI